MPRHLRYLLLPAVLLALGVTAGVVRTVEGTHGAATAPRSAGDSRSDAQVGRSATGAPHAAAGSATARASAAQPEPIAIASRVKSWPKHRKSVPGESCASCDAPASFDTPGQVADQVAANPRGLLTADRPSGPQAAAEQPNGLPPDVPASLKTSGKRGVVIRDAVDMGFPYEPKAWQDGLLEIDNRSGKDVFVSFHGQGAGQCLIDGQQVEEGRQYVVRGAAQIRGSSDVGVHVRTRGEGVETAPNGDG
jgi:hypothetical protein